MVAAVSRERKVIRGHDPIVQELLQSQISAVLYFILTCPAGVVYLVAMEIILLILEWLYIFSPKEEILARAWNLAIKRDNFKPNQNSRVSTPIL